MFRNLIGEWGQYEDWELTEIVIALESELSNARHEQKRRAKQKGKYLRREQRKQQILGLLGSGQILTTSQIASKLSLSASGHLRDILCELYRDGIILGYAEGKVASHPIYYWGIQKTIPLPLTYDDVYVACVESELLGSAGI